MGWHDIADDLLDEGLTEREVAAEIGRQVDALLRLDGVGYAGPALEALDGPAVTALVRLALAIRRDPARRAARRAERARRRALPGAT